MSETNYQTAIQDIEARVFELGPTIAEESVVKDSTAIHLAMPQTARSPRDLDLAVTQEAFRHFRTQPGWQEMCSQDGRAFLTDGYYDLEFNPKVSALTGLQARSWQTSGGVRIASLQDAYARKDIRNSDKDKRDTAEIRKRLLSPDHPPLSPHLMQREIAIIRAALPENDAYYDTPEAEALIRLAANGLFCISALYGDSRIRHANQIIGGLELPEYQVAATYHNGFGIAGDARLLQRQLDSLPVTPRERLLAMAADMYSDIVYGNGRKKNNLDGYDYDELTSAKLLVAHAGFLLGPDPARDKLLYEMVLGTTFDEATYQQVGSASPNPLVRAVTGVDLQEVLSGATSVEAAFDIIVEDGMSARFSPERILGRMLVAKGVRIGSVGEAMTFIDEYPDGRPEGLQTVTLKQYLINRLIGSASFRHPDTGIKLPHDWALDNPAARLKHAGKLLRLADGLQSNRITASKAYLLAQAYTAELEELQAA